LLHFVSFLETSVVGNERTILLLKQFNMFSEIFNFLLHVVLVKPRHCSRLAQLSLQHSNTSPINVLVIAIHKASAFHALSRFSIAASHHYVLLALSSVGAFSLEHGIVIRREKLLQHFPLTPGRCNTTAFDGFNKLRDALPDHRIFLVLE
jgi:hypothetical protein